jgi:hypothetical protein
MAMRDIRRDLEERLEAVSLERKRLEGQFHALEEKERVLKLLLEEEEARFSQISLPMEMPALPLKQYGPTRAFVLEMLGNGKAWTLAGLTDEALKRGLLADAKHPLRSLHFTLLGMRNNHLVEMPTSGHWKLAQNGATMT